MFIEKKNIYFSLQSGLPGGTICRRINRRRLKKGTSDGTMSVKVSSNLCCQNFIILEYNIIQPYIQVCQWSNLKVLLNTRLAFFPTDLYLVFYSKWPPCLFQEVLYLLVCVCLKLWHQVSTTKAMVRLTTYNVLFRQSMTSLTKTYWFF